MTTLCCTIIIVHVFSALKMLVSSHLEGYRYPDKNADVALFFHFYDHGLMTND